MEDSLGSKGEEDEFAAEEAEIAAVMEGMESVQDGKKLAMGNILSGDQIQQVCIWSHLPREDARSDANMPN